MTAPPVAVAGPGVLTATALRFDDLTGWESADCASALRAFLLGAGHSPDPALRALGSELAGSPRAFFERHFRPVLLDDGNPCQLTGYHEPELPGSLRPTSRFRHPLHAPPAGLQAGQRFAARPGMAERLAGQGLELVWLDDPVEVFLLHVQGSGRIRLPDGRLLRLGFAGTNGHPYRSIGRLLIERGEIAADQVSADRVREWVRNHGAEGLALLDENPSYVFFRLLEDLAPDQGPLGTLGVPLTPLVSIAVDPAVIPLGSPVWVEPADPAAPRGLMIAQDTGGAIRGAQRADLFFGWGKGAGTRAGNLKSAGRLVHLQPSGATGKPP